MGAALSRGHVDLFVAYRNMREDSKLVTVDEALLAAYMKAFDRVEADTGMRDDRSLSIAARLPEVMACFSWDAQERRRQSSPRHCRKYFRQ